MGVLHATYVGFTISEPLKEKSLSFDFFLWLSLLPSI